MMCAKLMSSSIRKHEGNSVETYYIYAYHIFGCLTTATSPTKTYIRLNKCRE